MSNLSNAAPSPSRLPRVSPRSAQQALLRARLSLVPRPGHANPAPRVPFVVLISALLLGGVLGLLFFNTSMQQASFRETALSQQARDLSAQQEALQLKLDQLRDPQRIAMLAQRMGMIIPAGVSGVLDLRSGKVSGSPVPATGLGLPLGPVPAHRPRDFDPPAHSTSVGSTGATTKTGTNSTKNTTKNTTKNSTKNTTKNDAAGKSKNGAKHAAKHGASTPVR